MHTSNAESFGSDCVAVLPRTGRQGRRKLPAIFGDHMVLQRDMPLPVWGWADPEEKVTVTLGDHSKTATADSDGKWSVKLDALKAGGPYVLKVEGKNTVEFSDVLVGEVWLGSGQSNMAMAVSGVLHKEAEIAAADYPQIRMFTVDRKTAEEPQERLQGQVAGLQPQDRRPASRPPPISSAASCTSN